MWLDTGDVIKVTIDQFYGIEINDFAVTVAKTALWIAESQMMKETEDLLHSKLEFLPLKSNAYIVEGNALRLDWEQIVPKGELNYIMGNPPFIGYSNQNKNQKDDVRSVFVDEKGKPYKDAGKIDYVSGWYFKAAQYVYGTEISVAFVSTNSITQGEQVYAIWNPLFSQFRTHIDFAYRTFIWDSEANEKAHVHCVIIGFSCTTIKKSKRIFEGNTIKQVSNINPYLLEGDNIMVKRAKKPLSENVPEMITGNRPADGGHLIIEAEDYDEFISAEPKATKYIRRLVGAEEFINNKKRYCLWLVDTSPSEIREMPRVMERVRLCKEDRLKGAPDRQRLANTPTLFRETLNPEKCILVPVVSSENRRYVPMGYLDNSIIANDRAKLIPDASLYHFGILESNVNMAWMRTVCGRLKSDYNYSKDIVYNNFPWCNPTEEQKVKIEQTAQGILDARALYPDSSLADLYDELTMPIELRKAHEANDKAVMQAYGFSPKMSEEEIVAELMKMYQKLTEGEK